jgi:hypothetical protein
MAIVAAMVGTLVSSVMSPIVARAAASTDTWTQVTSGSSPTARSGFAMAYDGVNQQALLFGGSTQSCSLFCTTTYLNDTWTWDGWTWTRLSPSVSPPARANAMMTWDAATTSVILFGGTTANGDVGDTWSWNGSTWTQLFPASSPSARDTGYLAYSAVLSQVVLFGGSGNTDTWTWNGSTWTLQAHGSNDPTSSGGAMAYDAATQNVVYQMASNAYPTYGWGAVCCNQPPTQGAWGYQGYVGQPNPTGSAMAYDENSQANIMFGGGSPGLFGSTINNATWSYNGFQWTQLSPTTSPSARYGAGMVTDPATGSIVLFGGTDANGNVLNDTWTYGDAYWGVDSVAPFEGNLSAVESCGANGLCGTPKFWGRYLDFVNYPSDSLTGQEVADAHTDGIKILLIDDNWSTATGMQNGTNAANAIINYAKNQFVNKSGTIGIPKNKVIVADIEASSAVDAGWIEGWFTAFHQDGTYRPGFYGTTATNSSFSNAFCAAVQAVPAVGGSLIWTVQPQAPHGTMAQAPTFAPQAPPCTAQMEAWQYRTSPLQNPDNPNVDEDEIDTALYPTLF